jgi:hypothetical protein
MDIVLIDKDHQPSDEELQAVLKRSFTHFNKIRELSKDQIQEWKYYGKKNGWLFKVSNKKRSLFYISPLAGSFLAGMTVNEADKELVLQSSCDDVIKSELREAKKYMEGYPIPITIKTKKDLDQLLVILKTINRL